MRVLVPLPDHLWARRWLCSSEWDALSRRLLRRGMGGAKGEALGPSVIVVRRMELGVDIRLREGWRREFEALTEPPGKGMLVDRANDRLFVGSTGVHGGSRRQCRLLGRV